MTDPNFSGFGTDSQRTVAGLALADSPLPAGYRLQEFVIEGLVGEGGFSIVYLARDTRLGRRVALKEYIPSTLAARRPDQQVTARSQRHRHTFELGLRSFVNEAQLLASFDHPSLIRVYRFWEENGTAYMVMPYVQGPTLKRWLTEHQGTHDEAWLRSLLDSLMEALELLHNDHCYHRDVAPDNILLISHRDGTLRPLLLDFGAARRVIGGATQALTVILKPGYAPIEQYAESTGTRQGPWTDIYALCAVMYAAITGSAPLPSVSRAVSDELVPLSKAAAGRYSQRFLFAIDAGMALRPERRPQSMQVLRELLDHAAPAAPADDSLAALMRDAVTGRQTRAQRDDDSAADPQAPAERFMAGDRRASGGAAEESAVSHPMALWLGLGALAVVLLGAAWWLTRDGAPARSPAPTAQSLPAPVVPTPQGDAQTAASPKAAAAPAPATEPPVGANEPPVGANEPPVGANESSGTAAATEVVPPAPSAPAPPAFPVAAALQDIVRSASPGLAVSAVLISDKPGLTIGRDSLQVRVHSAQAGYLYLFWAPTDKPRVSLLFPNRRELDNRIEAGQTITLPKPGWVIRAEEPPGTNHLVAMVSRVRRDHTSSGLQHAGRGYADFDLRVVQQRWRPRQNAPNPFVGRPICDAGAACIDAWGAALLQIDGVSASARR